MTTAEVRAIVATARERARRTRKDKSNMALFVVFLAYTGLRHEEAARCMWGDLDLGADIPVLVSNPAWAKNGRRDLVPLHAELVELLNEHRKAVPDAKNKPVFPRVPNRHTWAVDRESAGVAREDARGRAATFHSLRKWLATTLDRNGASPGTVAKILRHADGITQARYIDADLTAQVAAVQTLPRLWAKNGENALEEMSSSADSLAASPMVATTPQTPSLSRARPLGEAFPQGMPVRRALEVDCVSERPTSADRPPKIAPRRGNGHVGACAQSVLLDVIEDQARVILRLVGLLREERAIEIDRPA